MDPIKLVRSFGLLVLLASAFGHAQTSANGTQVEELRKQLNELRKQMSVIESKLDAMETSSANAPATPPPATPAATVPPEESTVQTVQAMPTGPVSGQIGEQTRDYRTFSEDPLAAARLNNIPVDPKYHGFFFLPGTRTMMKIGGYAKSDFIYDLKPAGNTDEFIPATIPIPAPAGVNNATISIRPTRLTLDFVIPASKFGDVRFYFEGDLFGTNATTPRLRHAYGQANNFLLGQTFTNFMDPDAFPDTLDFEGPNSMVNIRNPQFRYGFGLGKDGSFYVSVEKPSSDVSFTTPNFSSEPSAPSPDGALRFRQEFPAGHFQVSSIFRSVGAAVGTGTNTKTDFVFAWGINAAGAVKTFGKDNLIAEGTYGHGIARYLQDTSGLGIDAAVISVDDPHLRATPEVGVFGAYQHYWTKSVRSSVVYGFAQVENTDFQPGSTYHKSDYSAANLIWNPIGSFNVGAEFLYGWQVLKDGQSGNAPRIQFSAKYNFVNLGPSPKK
ncbi:DcaP family trimeric outer membrane transporter [Acidobacterium sp. S8]|uniref:DcaP family trimeric outer membrane transporter n=1 Tax=Acidobacterium sp. S8 TaxID=1641854 RepID=UPI00131C9C19|nr:DcaP family trimeric outer membrane transporter [Acidobacterium sp. S8]